jgi:hypothetical protein
MWFALILGQRNHLLGELACASEIAAHEVTVPEPAQDGKQLLRPPQTVAELGRAAVDAFHLRRRVTSRREKRDSDRHLQRQLLVVQVGPLWRCANQLEAFGQVRNCFEVG